MRTFNFKPGLALAAFAVVSVAAGTCLAQTTVTQGTISAPTQVTRKSCERVRDHFLVQQKVASGLIKPFQLSQYLRTKALLEFLLTDAIQILRESETELGNADLLHSRETLLALAEIYLGYVRENLLRIGMSTVVHFTGSEEVWVSDGAASWPYHMLVFGQSFFSQCAANLRVCQGDIFSALMLYTLGSNRMAGPEVDALGQKSRRDFWEILGEARLGNQKLWAAVRNPKTDWLKFDEERGGAVFEAETSTDHEDLELGFRDWLESDGPADQYSAHLVFAEACEKAKYIKMLSAPISVDTPPKRKAAEISPEKLWFLPRELGAIRTAYTLKELQYASRPSMSEIFKDPRFSAFADATHFYFSILTGAPEDKVLVSFIRVAKERLKAEPKEGDPFALKTLLLAPKAGISVKGHRVVLNVLEIEVIGTGTRIPMALLALNESLLRLGRLKGASEEAIEKAYSTLQILSDYEIMGPDEYMEKLQATPGYRLKDLNYY